MTLSLRFDGCALQCSALADFDWNMHLPRSASVQLRTPIFAVIRSPHIPRESERHFGTVDQQISEAYLAPSNDMFYLSRQRRDNLRRTSSPPKRSRPVPKLTFFKLHPVWDAQSAK